MRTKLLLMLVAVAMFACGSVAMGDIVTRRIQTNYDDAEEYLTNYYAGSPGYQLGEGWLASSDLELGSEWSTLCWTGFGLQYDQLGIPEGALITSAKVTFTVDEDERPGSSNDFTILGEVAANAVAWGTTEAIIPFDVTSRARTSASAGWSPTDPAIGSTIDTPDLTGIMQAIVNHPDWSDNNRLTLLMFPDAYLNSAPLTTDVTGHTYKSGASSTLAPLLTVEFDPYPGKATLVAPFLWDYVDLALLEWERPAPRFPAIDNHVTVNVLFGTDPNLIVGVNGTVQIEFNFDGDSTAQFPGHDLALDTEYSWRVDCIDPNNGSPVTTEGYTWTFITTIPPSVTITESGGSTNVSEEDRLANRDDYILTLSRDPGAGVSVSVTVSEVISLRTTTRETMEAFDGATIHGDLTKAPELQVTHSGGTAVSSRISSSLDDSEEWLVDNWNYAYSTDLEFFTDGGGQVIGLRFNNVDIPKGAPIDSAIVEFEVDETNPPGEVHVIVTGELVTNAPAVTETQFHLQDRLAANPTTATSSFVWTEDYAVSTKVPTSDISSIIQEIVDRGPWKPGNSILLFFTEDMTLDDPDIEFIDATDPWAPRSSTYVLDSSNWETGVTVTIAAIDDSLIEADPELATLAATTSSADSDWDGLQVADVVVTILENDCGAWGYGPADFDESCTTGLEDLAVAASAWFNNTELTAPVAK